MHLLVTRAPEDAARTKAKLEAAGYRVLVSPVIEIVGTGAVWPHGVVDLLFASSSHAFHGIDEITAPTLETRRLIPLFCVGDRTAESARERGFAGSMVVAPNVAVLAVAIGKIPTATRRALYLAGRDRKSDLETALDVIGVHPEVIETYEARPSSTLDPNAVDALRKGSMSGVLHFSHRSAALFAQAAAASDIDIRQLTHFCLSEDTATPLRAAGCESIRIAEQPNESALLQLIDAT